jgi:hypothetical protein
MGRRPTVIDRMELQARSWEAHGDRRALFLRCYSLMTANMLRAVEEGRFLDPPWVNELLHLFADYYFLALEQYESAPQSAPAIWRHAHDATRFRSLHVMQSLLLGVNAHINYDLVLALRDMLQSEWMGSSEEQKRARYQDHFLVNTIIAETIDAVQDRVIEVEDPRMDMIDRFMGRLDERLITRLITRWRESVWKNAQALILATCSGEPEPMRRRVENGAMRRARMLAAGGSR